MNEKVPQTLQGWDWFKRQEAVLTAKDRQNDSKTVVMATQHAASLQIAIPADQVYAEDGQVRRGAVPGGVTVGDVPVYDIATAPTYDDNVCDYERLLTAFLALERERFRNSLLVFWSLIGKLQEAGIINGHPADFPDIDLLLADAAVQSQSAQLRTEKGGLTPPQRSLERGRYLKLVVWLQEHMPKAEEDGEGQEEQAESQEESQAEAAEGGETPSL